MLSKKLQRYAPPLPLIVKPCRGIGDPFFSYKPITSKKTHSFNSTKARRISGLKYWYHLLAVYSCSSLCCFYFNILPAVFSDHEKHIVTSIGLKQSNTKHDHSYTVNSIQILQSSFSNSAQHVCQHYLSCLK